MPYEEAATTSQVCSTVRTRARGLGQGRGTGAGSTGWWWDCTDLGAVGGFACMVLPVAGGGVSGSDARCTGFVSRGKQ
jgi:hypothetical protein